MIRVRVCRCVRVCVLEPHISAFSFYFLVGFLLLAAMDTTTVCELLICMFGHYICVYMLCVLHVRAATVQQQSHSKLV